MGESCGGCGKCCSGQGGSKNILQDLIEAKSYISGSQLAKKYKITRQALNKQINKLIQMGYDISAVSKTGYKLISLPDKLDAVQIQAGLKTRFIGREIDYYTSTSSTQEICWHAGLNGSDEGFLAVSEIQTAGRGRMQRAWISKRGGIYFSLLLRPTFLTLRDVPKLTLSVGLAVQRALSRNGFVCSLKWPNDLLINGKKVCGILCDLEADMDAIHFVVCGIGINVNNSDFPPTGTSLSIVAKQKQLRIKILQDILFEIENMYEQIQHEGFTSLLRQWSKACTMWGKPIKVRVTDKDICGIAQGIDDEGRLLMKTAMGRIEKFHSGDVTLAKK
jgi:BirA family biotin operon repressor/biotin-[acetyl-CoA-carboxylase] ligase